MIETDDPRAGKGMQEALARLSAAGDAVRPILDPEKIAKLQIGGAILQSQRMIGAAVNIINSEQFKVWSASASLIASRVQQISVAVNAALIANREEIGKFTKTLTALATLDWDVVIDRHADALVFASEYGWFIQEEFSLSDIAKISAMAAESDVESLDETFIGWMREHQDIVLQNLLERYPERTEIIQEAFNLHGASRYIASIPLMLTTAEGIGHGKTSFSAFNTDKNRPQIALHWKKQTTSRSEAIFIRPLTENHSLSKPKKGRLNRHLVLHGKDYQYGNEMNSLQAMSFLGNICWILSRNDAELSPEETRDDEAE